ncbi:hypothetical protein SODALDRAFT_327138 [Sodiomyces alkalinus F11]|uniref:Uncharacterized protein n=1 Tax=Sodiomyces alkalinus (strain CBS 110278 / VKM F-3762 / F11) TaxID=1314773 RepID=A0A3N2Q8G3_SODAK|nr:hypothetical protein SODALDRAFT_327138 [Sodiomyces alkalinus F11]ROT42977.1 hypothetical protein SODALDRAFT_327138 [Sodiomyces alkalinus F11]
MGNIVDAEGPQFEKDGLIYWKGTGMFNDLHREINESNNPTPEIGAGVVSSHHRSDSLLSPLPLTPFPLPLISNTSLTQVLHILYPSVTSPHGKPAST